MDFDFAWKFRDEDNVQEDKKAVAEAEILFDCDGYGPGTASMLMGKYYKDKDEAGKMLKRACETFCKGKPGMDLSIRLITVCRKKSVDSSKKSNNEIKKRA